MRLKKALLSIFSNRKRAGSSSTKDDVVGSSRDLELATRARIWRRRVGSPLQVLAVLVATIVVASSILVPVGAAAATGPPSGFVGVADGNIVEDLPENVPPDKKELIAEKFPDVEQLRGSTLTTRGAESLEVTITSKGRASGRNPRAVQQLALVFKDDVDHAGRRVALPAKPMIDALGYVPAFAYGTHEDGDKWRRPIERNGRVLIFEIPRFSSNTVTFAGTVELTGSPATDGTTYSYELGSHDAVDEFVINVTGATASEWDNATAAGIGAPRSTLDTSTEFSDGSTANGFVVNGSRGVELDGVNISETFGYTGSEQTWVVPEGVDQVRVKIKGAGSSGQAGGYVEGTLDVTPGETLRIYVGQEGQRTAGGWPNGGNGDSINLDSDSGAAQSWGGGGSSDIRQGGATLGDRVAVAGGAGGDAHGAGFGSSAGGGGQGGADTGASGAGADGAGGGSGGDQSSGGSGGTGGDASGQSGSSGSLSNGGSGGVANDADGDCAGGGGGGGYYGGGGGGASDNAAGTDDCGAGGGGGGSNYDDGLASVTANERGTGSTTNGEVVIEAFTPPQGQPATFISPVEAVESSSSATVTFAENTNATVDIFAEVYNGTAWVRVASKTGITTTGTHSLSWSEAANDQVRINVSAYNEQGTGAPQVRVDEIQITGDANGSVAVGGNAAPSGPAAGSPELRVTGHADANGDTPTNVEFTIGGTTYSFGSIGDGVTETKTVTSLGLSTSSIAVSFTNGKVDYELVFQERTQTVDPAIEVNGQTTSYSGTLTDGQTEALAVNTSWIVEGTNRINVTLNDAGVGADAPTMGVDLTYSHRAVDDQTVSYGQEQLTERYNVSRTFASDQVDANLTIPFASNVVEVRAVEKRVDGGSWSDVGPGSYSLTGTTLVVELGTVSANETIDVRANGSRIEVNNGTLTVLEATAVGSDLDSKVRLDSWNSDSYLKVGTDASGELTHYAGAESWSSTADYVVITAGGQQTVYLPNAADGSTFRLRTLPLEASPELGDVEVEIEDADALKFAVRPGPNGIDTGDVAFTYTAAAGGTDYILYSLTHGIVRDSGTASSPVTLTDDDSDELLQIQEDDGGGSSGGGGGGGGGGGAAGAVVAVSSGNPLNSLPIVLIVGVASVALVGFVSTRYIDDDLVVLGLTSGAALIVLVVAGEGLNPGVILGPIGEGFGEVVPVLALAGGGFVLWFLYRRFIKGQEPPTIEVRGRIK